MKHFKVPYKAKKWKKCKTLDVNAFFDEAWIDAQLTKKLSPRTVEDFFEEAGAKLIERGQEYDRPAGERSAGPTAAAFNAITGRDLRPAEVWLILQIVKDVRQFTGAYHQDSAVDGIAYSALKAEALASEA